MTKFFAITFTVCVIFLVVIHSSFAAGDKGGGSNIILSDKHSQIVLNSGGKKGSDNIVIRDKPCCNQKRIKV